MDAGESRGADAVAGTVAVATWSAHGAIWAAGATSALSERGAILQQLLPQDIGHRVVSIAQQERCGAPVAAKTHPSEI